ncbi:MAG: alpha-hydroxy-acid oxidizing protein [Roseburia sp.]|nr:alpha-hydroxy-acid oxidizing protein [Roseburia sp.]
MAKDSNQITRDYFESLLVEMRHIDAVKPDSAVTLFGETFQMPVATAALSHLNNTCEEGMAKMAEGARLAGALCFSGMGERQELADMCATGARVIKIIKPHADNALVFAKIREAEEAGAFGIGMDIDHAFNGQGEYDCVCGLPMEPKSLEELRSFIQASKLPFIIKGVLSVSDAAKALEAGAAGIIVSHHHGILDYAVPPLLALPEIVREVKGRIPIFVDCCVESGMDVFKALALGADAVCVGRAIMGPLKEQGALGVCDKLVQMAQELRGVMARTGFASPGQIESSVLWKRNF